MSLELFLARQCIGSGEHLSIPSPNTEVLISESALKISRRSTEAYPQRSEAEDTLSTLAKYS